MTRVVISQPMYFPRVGFLAQMALADVLIWLDDAQFSKGSFTSRVQVKTPQGQKWMSIPLLGKGDKTPIRDLGWISDGGTVTAHCGPARFGADALSALDKALEQTRGDTLCETIIVSARGIDMHYMRYDPLPWPQAHGDFTPYVTGLDLIAACPPDTRATHLNPATIPWQGFLDQKAT